MNEYLFEGCKVGLTASFDVEITEEMVSQFRNNTRDMNPLHVDNQYAESKGFKAEVVYGMLTASFFSTLVGMYLPGRYALLLGIDVQFPKPVYVGDVLTITGIVKERDEYFRRITIKSEIRNQNGEKVARANLLVGFVG